MQIERLEIVLVRCNVKLQASDEVPCERVVWRATCITEFVLIPATVLPIPLVVISLTNYCDVGHRSPFAPPPRMRS